MLFILENVFSQEKLKFNQSGLIDKTSMCKCSFFPPRIIIYYFLKEKLPQMLIEVSRECIQAVKGFLAVMEQHCIGQLHFIFSEVDFDVCSLYILLNF